MAAESGNTAVVGKDQEGILETKRGPFSFLSKFNLPNPFFNPAAQTASPSSDLPTSAVVGEEIDAPKPNVARFPNARPVVPPHMEVEVEESSHRTHNPVYAMGGFIIVKWVWARWNERKERAKKGSSSSSSEAEETQNPENESPGEGED
ncbi:hypothetical protein LINGRAPRIM_LOCUS2184 [Linum grandiflorum]